MSSTVKNPKQPDWLFYSYLLISLSILGGLGYFAYTEYQSRTQLEVEKQNIKQELAEASGTIEDLNAQISNLNSDMEILQEKFNEEKEQNDVFRDQIADLGGTIDTLNKLSQIDEELLQKYSRVYFLNENYRPERLERIDGEWILEGRDEQYFHKDAWPYLEDLLEDAKRDGIELRVLSAFRSFEEQNELKGQFTQQYGSGSNAFSADQGYSEHQLGTTVDLVDPQTAATSQTFAQTEEYEWLLDNAYKHGFVLSYPENNDYYIFEPWHWRFVGEKLARELEQTGDHFYDWEQREIDAYLISLFD